MISELTFIKENNTFWQNLLPGSDQYIRLVNSVILSEVYKPLEIEESPERRVLTNNISFALFRMLIRNELKVEELADFDYNTDSAKKIISKEIFKLSSIRLREQLVLEINSEEKLVIEKLSKRLYDYYSNKEQVVVHPYFEGCGFLNAAEGDVLYNSTLSEVKSGNSKFKIRDLRQLFTYLALNFANKTKFNITHIELFNPRRGEQWIDNVEDLAYKLAACSLQDLLNEIIIFISDEFKSI